MKLGEQPHIWINYQLRLVHRRARIEFKREQVPQWNLFSFAKFDQKITLRTDRAG